MLVFDYLCEPGGDGDNDEYGDEVEWDDYDDYDVCGQFYDDCDGEEYDDLC